MRAVTKCSSVLATMARRLVLPNCTPPPDHSLVRENIRTAPAFVPPQPNHLKSNAHQTKKVRHGFRNLPQKLLFRSLWG